jgi:hypothetical protein
MSAISSPARLVCEGLSIGNCRVPPFEVRAGELIKLEFPSHRAIEQRAMLNILAAPSPEGPIRAAGKVVVVERPRTRPPLLEIFHQQVAIEWLCARAGLSREQALPWLQAEACPWLRRVHLEPETPLAEMAGTPKKLLGIQAAFALRPDTIVFDTDGLDPMGIRDSLQAVHEQLGNSSAVYLTWVDDIDWPEFKFAAVYPVSELEIEHTTSS